MNRFRLQLANPFYYPLAVLVAAIVLVVGVRVLLWPRLIMLVVAAGIATGSAMLLQARQTQVLNLDNPELTRDLQQVRQRARLVAERAEVLRQEAGQLLTDADQIDLLATVQYACDRAVELPQKLEQLARHLQGSDSLLSPLELQQQLKRVQRKRSSSTGVAREQLAQLEASLQRNLQLARQGEDARQAQVVSLSTLILEAAGMLQDLQNKLRTANLGDRETAAELRSLSETLTSTQENLDLLVEQS